MEIPGHRMRVTARYIAEHPGCSKTDAARGESWDGIRTHYGAVERLIARGYVRADPGAHWAYRLYLTEAGQEFTCRPLSALLEGNYL